MIRGALVLLALLLPASGCSEGISGMEGDCLAQIEWNGETYDGVGETDLTRGEELSRGVIPGCGDADASTDVFAIQGVDPDVAVLTGADAWAGPGYLVLSTKHPLHYDSRRDFSDGTWNCSPERSLRAEVAVTPPGVEDWIETRQGLISLDRNTVFEGIDRNGIPYVEDGDELEFVIRECAAKEPKADDPENIPLLVAAAIRP